MALKFIHTIDLPAHTGTGGFDHAAVHGGLNRLYVAHTANDALDIIDTETDRYLESIPGLTGVAGALVAEEHGLLFTSNRGENTAGIMALGRETEPVRVVAGVRPNGLAYAAPHHLLLAANVGDPQQPGSHTVTLIDSQARARLADTPVPGRTRWTIYDALADTFYVNIADPARIVVVNARPPFQILRAMPIPAAGPHGLDLDPASGRLFCACDVRTLFCLAARDGTILNQAPLAGVPDVIFFNAALRRLYVAIGDPGLIEVFETEGLRQVEAVPTGPGAHTLGFDAARNKVYAFLPGSHAAAVYHDAG